MKRHLLLAVSVSVISTTFAQQNNMLKIREGADISKLRPLHKTDYNDPLSPVVTEPNPTVSSGASFRSNHETIIGVTTYDLQSNASVQKRVYVWPDEKVSAVWTTSNSGDISAADRGTGYNHFNGTSWVNGTNAQVSRIESAKTGWPSLFKLGNGEGTISHTATNTLSMAKTTSPGSTSWAVSTVPSPITDLLWPRSKSNEAGTKIHLFALTTPTANGGAVFQGLDGAMTYSRSTDGGLTWDIQKMILPGMSDTDGYFGFSGDSYSMDVKGDTVVLLIGDQWYDTFLMKSTDGGTTWNKSMIWQFPIANYDWQSDNMLSDVNNDGIADTILSNDGGMWVSLDNNGMAHCFFGQLRGLNATVNDGNSSFFPFTDGLCYWNENMTANQFDTIAGIVDLNSNDTIDADDVGTYFLSLSGMPSAMIDTNGDIYVTYSSIVEGTDIVFGQAFRNVYAIKSTDGGATWTAPNNITPSDFDESVFATLGNRAPTNLHVVFQRDELPGLAVRGDEHTFVNNSIVYMELSKALDVSTPEHIEEEVSTVKVFPNPASNRARITFETTVSGNTTVILTNILGSTVSSFNRNVNAGSNTVDLDLTDLKAGVYLVTVNTPNGSSTSRLVVQ